MIAPARPAPLWIVYAGGRRGLGAYTPIQQQIINAANSIGVDPSLALAIAQQESSFNPQAKSPAGAIGLFQLMPATAASVGVNPNDPSQNITGGLTYFKQLLDHYGGDVSSALAAYNEGPGNFAKGNMPAETAAYVPAVLAAQANYADVAAGSPTGSPGDTGGSLADLLAGGGSDATGMPDYTTALLVAGTVAAGAIVLGLVA